MKQFVLILMFGVGLVGCNKSPVSALVPEHLKPEQIVKFGAIDGLRDEDTKLWTSVNRSLIQEVTKTVWKRECSGEGEVVRWAPQPGNAQLGDRLQGAILRAGYKIDPHDREPQYDNQQGRVFAYSKGTRSGGAFVIYPKPGATGTSPTEQMGFMTWCDFK